ncbi:hypothetical protein [Natronorubrum sp. FCH18a]|uniref:hypothetical protein n=1 Tax=Natronorubrum sp. FCH18a TaxID=3447018 RepID=UPI003F516D5C
MAALIVGIVHAGLVLGVALRYGYDVGPAAYPPHIVVWRYGGLVVLGALPVWLVLEDRLLLPIALITVLAGLAFYAELTPPEPTFRDVADLEPSVDRPTGITVIEDGLHLVKYASQWYVWTVGAGLLGGVEHMVRARSRWLPAPGWEFHISGSSRQAVLVGLVAGVMHAAASVAYAWRWGVGDDLVMVIWMLVGGILMVGVPAYLLVRHRLVVPLTVAAVLFVNSVYSQQYAGPGDPHALYAGAWFIFLGITLLTGVLEYAVYTVRVQSEQSG